MTKCQVNENWYSSFSNILFTITCSNSFVVTQKIVMQETINKLTKPAAVLMGRAVCRNKVVWKNRRIFLFKLIKYCSYVQLIVFVWYKCDGDTTVNTFSFVHFQPQQKPNLFFNLLIFLKRFILWMYYFADSTDGSSNHDGQLHRISCKDKELGIQSKR